MRTVFIIHFQPLEFFPPAMNLIDFLSKEKTLKVIVSTNGKPAKNSLKTYTNPSAKILRPASLSHKGLLRYAGYFLYYFSTFIALLRYRPKTVLYIETLSSWPALWYKKLRGSKVRILAHYHEYTEPKLYQEGMLLSRIMHRAERGMYQQFSWISHTNPVRMQMFKDDCHLNQLNPSIFHLLPNYPPGSWADDITLSKPAADYPKKMVFVGSLGYKNMYLQEMIDWLGTHQKEFSLDIYSYNIDSEARKAIDQCGLSNIRFFGGCDYQALPEILSRYDIGLVIYKPFSKNTIHAVSNKVFEYLACGLDVWFSEDMTYTFEYCTENTYPKVLPVNFQSLDSFDYKKAISREGLTHKPSTYFCEDIYEELLSHILQANERTAS